MTSNADWPEIPGVESGAVREQLRGDARLFVRLLRKLCADYADLREIAAATDAATIHDRRGQAHKLKGVAGTLGVTAAYEFAQRAEAAAAAGEVAAFVDAIVKAAGELEALCAALAKVVHPPVVTDCADDTPVDLAGLSTQLRQQSLSALRRFDAAESGLCRVLGADVTQRLRDMVDHMRFAAAADLIDQHRAEQRAN